MYELTISSTARLSRSVSSLMPSSADTSCIVSSYASLNSASMISSTSASSSSSLYQTFSGSGIMISCTIATPCSLIVSGWISP